MSDSHDHEATMNALDLFPAADWDAFRRSDTQAARAIVILMLTIFCTGIVLYSIFLYLIILAKP